MTRRHATVEARRKLLSPTTCNEAVGRDLFEPSMAQRILELVADTLSDEEPTGVLSGTFDGFIPLVPSKPAAAQRARRSSSSR